MSYLIDGCYPPWLANVDSFARSPIEDFHCGDGDNFGYRCVSDFVTHGLILHQTGEYQAVSERGGCSDEGNLGLYSNIEEAAFQLVMQMKAEGLLDRYWSEIINE